MIDTGLYIKPSRKYECVLEEATVKAFKDIKNNYLCKIPDNWGFTLDSKKISFKDIRKKMAENGYSTSTIMKFYGEDSSIETDSFIIKLIVKNNSSIIEKPIFIGEDKKQGTNDERIKEGKKKQAIGNAVDRTAKNFIIVSDYCYLCDEDFFPYVIFAHGCDFGEDITKTTKSKLSPYVGELNVLNPFFDKQFIGTHKGGSCFYQENEFTFEQIYKICYDTCVTGIDFYLKKFKENNHNEKKTCECETVCV